MSTDNPSSLSIQTSTDPIASVPAWFGEVALIAHTLTRLGVLADISERVGFTRKRFGTYEVIDFVVMLMGYAISGEPTLKAYYERVQPLAPAFMALFGRSHLPHRATLSRFLAALDETAVEALRTVFLHDALARLGPEAGVGGLWDRQGTRGIIFDLDGTRQAARQRALPQGPVTHSESGICRDLFDGGEVPVTAQGHRSRLIVATHQAATSPIGVIRDQRVYELFFTALPALGFSAADVVKLYLHRGGFETVLADEDREQDSDRWSSYTPHGQEVWQILSQWIWNLRQERRADTFLPCCPSSHPVGGLVAHSASPSLDPLAAQPPGYRASSPQFTTSLDACCFLARRASAMPDHPALRLLRLWSMDSQPSLPRPWVCGSLELTARSTKLILDPGSPVARVRLLIFAPTFPMGHAFCPTRLVMCFFFSLSSLRPDVRPKEHASLFCLLASISLRIPWAATFQQNRCRKCPNAQKPEVQMGRDHRNYRLSSSCAEECQH